MAYNADKKPLDLTALTSLATDDTFIVGDTSDTSEVVKTIAKSALITDLSTSFATAAQGAKADSAQQPPAEGAFVDGDKTKLDGIETGAEANVVDSVNAQTGAVVLDADDIDDTSTTNKFVTASDVTKLSNLSGTNTGDQDLSTYQVKPAEGAFVDGDKTKLDGIEAGADVTDEAKVSTAGAPIISSGSGAPSSTPNKVGDIYIDTTNDISYIATGTASSSDWKVQATGTAGTPAKGSILVGDGVDSFDELTAGSDDQVIVYDSGESLGAKKVDLNGGINFIIDGGGSAITTGIKGDIEIPYDCTIQSITLLADQSGSIVIDIWKDSYANYPATDVDSITASAVPTISSATKSTDSTLTGWTKTLSAGDILRFNVDSITTCERVTLSLKVKRNF